MKFWSFNDATTTAAGEEKREAASSSAAAAVAAVRLERITGGKSLTPETGQRWFDYASRILELKMREQFDEEQAARHVALVLRRVDEILEF